MIKKTALALLATCSLMACSNDVIISNFEEGTYGDWKVEGTAFGDAPVSHEQDEATKIAIRGYSGNYFVNSSFAEGDNATGKLISPSFKVNRQYLNLKVGGGNHVNQTCVNIKCGDTLIASLTGGGASDDEFGTSRNFLVNESIDLSAYQGKEVYVEIVDDKKGAFGAIYVDDIVLSNEKANSNTEFTYTIDKRYLLFPTDNTEKDQHVVINMDDEFFTSFDLQLPKEEPDFYCFLDLSRYQGRKLTLSFNKLENAYRESAASIKMSDTVPGFDSLYTEKLRPKFHYTCQRGWLSDPNGLVYYNGTYHMYYQHNPVGWYCHNIRWGHATSKDLIHWEQQDIPFMPPTDGDRSFSGSLLVDFKNDSGFQTGDQPALVGAFTCPRRGDCVIYSNDGGYTFQEYEKNPVRGPFPHFYDPGVMYYAPGDHYVMAGHMSGEYHCIHTSKDLKNWTYRSRTYGFHSCQHIYNLPDPRKGHEGEDLWVICGMRGEYMIGHFDGYTFTPMTEHLQIDYGTSYVAAQNFSNMPDGRQVFLAFTYNGPSPDMPFNMNMIFPVEHKLKETKFGLRVCPSPIPEIAMLHDNAIVLKDKTVEEINTVLKNSPVANTGEMHLKMKFKNAKDQVKVKINGAKITLDAQKDTITFKGGLEPPVGPFANAGTPWRVNIDKNGEVHGPMDMSKDEISLEVLLDKTTVEVFGNDGEVYMPISMYFHPDLLAGVFGWPNKKYEPVQFIDPEIRGVELSTSDKDLIVSEFELYSMKSMWEEQIKK